MSIDAKREPEDPAAWRRNTSIMLPEFEKECVEAYGKYRQAREAAQRARKAFDLYKTSGFVDEASIRTAFVAAMEKADSLRLGEVAHDHATMLAACIDWKSAEEKLQLATAALQNALTAFAREIPR